MSFFSVPSSVLLILRQEPAPSEGVSATPGGGGPSPLRSAQRKVQQLRSARRLRGRSAIAVPSDLVMIFLVIHFISVFHKSGIL